jgi:hypothetical protein
VGLCAAGETRKRGGLENVFDRPVSWVPVLELPSIKQEAFRILPQKNYRLCYEVFGDFDCVAIVRGHSVNQV